MIPQVNKVRISNTWHFPLPRDMCKDMGIKPGDTLCMFTAGGILHVVPEDSVDVEKERLRLSGISIDGEDKS